jgi:hypothetical protein
MLGSGIWFVIPFLKRCVDLTIKVCANVESVGELKIKRVLLYYRYPHRGVPMYET